MNGALISTHQKPAMGYSDSQGNPFNRGAPGFSPIDSGVRHYLVVATGKQRVPGQNQCMRLVAGCSPNDAVFYTGLDFTQGSGTAYRFGEGLG